MKTLAAFALSFAAAWNTPAQEVNLGRLFFTPEQRARMDQQRLRGIDPNLQAENGGSVTLNGLVTRSSGRSTAWLNGIPVEDQRPNVQLRPGETSAPSLREAPSDVLNGGQIRVHRAGR